jgi:O-methyltransferase
MMASIKNLAWKTFYALAPLRYPRFRITLYDFLRKTRNLRGDESPFTLYRDWRKGQIERLGLDFFKEYPEYGDFSDKYYGKIDRIGLALSFLDYALEVEGDVVEFGVHYGHTAVALNRRLQAQGSDKNLWLFDSFEGMPEISNPLDSAWERGDLAAPVEVVERVFKDDERVKIVPGFFSDSLPKHPDLKLAFCHVDADLYESIKECIEYIMPRLSPGGIIVFDDYGFRSCPGAKVAIHEAFDAMNQPVTPLPTGQAVYINLRGALNVDRGES